MSDKQIRAHFKYCQIKTHVQTAREPHDLNTASDSFTLRISMQEYLFLQRIRYAKLFETAKLHVQIMKFTCCLNMALILSKPKFGLDLFGIALHVQGYAL